LLFGKGTIITDPAKCPKMVIGLNHEDWPELNAWIWKKQRYKPKPDQEQLQTLTDVVIE
jgi:hypothetical protein